MAFTIYMVRHGQTFLNKYNRLQGWCDSPLTPKGMEDAHSAGRHLAHINFDHASHSDTTRAMRTCRYILEENIASNDITPKEIRNFREQSFGYFEGNDSSQVWTMLGAQHGGYRSYNELIANYSLGKTRDFLNEIDPFKDAETDEQYWARINAGFDHLRRHRQDGENILLVSHSITIRSIVDRFAPELGAAELGPRNGSVTKLIVSKDDIKVEYYNHHLDNETY